MHYNSINTGEKNPENKATMITENKHVHIHLFVVK